MTEKIEVAEKCDTCQVTLKGLDTVQECACCPESNGGTHHKYSAKTCGVCGRVFCYSCCGGTNVDQGGKYEADYMFCPECGADFYAPERGIK